MKKLTTFTTAMVALGAIATPALAQASDTNEPAKASEQSTQADIKAPTREIVVRGQTLDDSLRALEDCLARGCPPEEDIRLTLAHSEGLFIAGDYRDSRSFLRKSIGRNSKHGDDLPIAVSNLYRANSRISVHQGEAKDYQLSVLNMRDALDGGLGSEDPRTLVAEVTVGDSRAKLGYPKEAERIYERVQKQAEELGNGRVATYAIIRQILLKQAFIETPSVHPSLKAKKEREMMELVDQVRNHPLEGGEEFSLVVDVIMARKAAADGNEEPINALLKTFAEKSGATRPLLIHANPLPVLQLNETSTSERGSPSPLSHLINRNSVGKWADVGFWINQDGKVEDVEILRSEGTGRWLGPVTDNIRKRLYAPVARSDNDPSPGFYMIERYSLTARQTRQATGTRMRKREPILRIEQLDITAEDFERPQPI